MRFGCCTNMVSQNKDKTGIEAIGQLKAIGYDFVELPLAQLMDLDDNQFQVLREKVMNSGLKCEACNNFFPLHMQLTGTGVDTAKNLDYVRRAFERASVLGTEVVVFGSGRARMVPSGFPKEKAWEQLVVLLDSVDNIASEFNIVVVIEPLRKLESNIVNSLAEGSELVKSKERENIKLLADSFHMLMEKEDSNRIVVTGANIKHVHFAMTERRLFPNMRWKDDFSRDFLGSLKQINYNGRISIEAYSENLDVDAVRAYRFLSDFFS